MRRFSFLLLCALLALALPAKADEADAKKAAVEAMQAWLKGIDAGDYAASWDQASKTFQAAITKDKWVAALEAVRKPLGDSTSRQLASAMEQKDIPTPTGGVLSGDFVIAQFESSFANLKFAIETVTFEKQDGAWKASGYFVKPK